MICKSVEDDNYPIFCKGDELILFLRVVESDGLTLYVPQGGPQGCYKVIDDKVYPIGNRRHNSKLETNCTQVNTFVEYLKSLG